MSTTWKWVPVARYDISTMEKWLEQMAAKGLFYQRDQSSNPLFHAFIVGDLARFEIGPPKPGRRYRLDVNPDFYNIPTGQMRDLYQQAGWEYAGFLWDRAFFIYYTDDPLAVEPYTDPHSQADSLQSLKKITGSEINFRLSHFNSIFYLLFFGLTAPHLSNYRNGQHFLHVLFSSSPGEVLLFLFWTAAIILSLFASVRSRNMAKRMKQHLEEGNSLKTFAPPKGQLALETAQSIMMAVVLLSLALYLPVVRRSSTRLPTAHDYLNKLLS